MTNHQAKQIFVEAYYGNNEQLKLALKQDKLAVQFAWACFTDSMCRDGEITMKQYETWLFPWR